MVGVITPPLTGAEIKILYEAEANAFTDTKNTKLAGIATAATKYPDTGEQAFLDADHTKLNGIATAATKYPNTGEQAFLDADHTKLNGIEAGAEVNDSGFTTVNDVTGSRAVTTVYRNTTGKTMFVAISIGSDAGYDTIGYAYADSSTPPTTIVSKYKDRYANGKGMLVFMVKDDDYYKIDDFEPHVIIDKWMESY